MNVTLVRHGQTNYNVKGLCSESPGTNVHLTLKGELQAKLLAKQLQDNTFDMIYTSELYRTQQTAELINKYHKAPHKTDGRLNDRYTGFDGKPINDFYETIRHDPLHARPPGGETLQEAKQRVNEFLNELKTKHYDNVLIVTHSIVVKLLLLLIQGKSDNAIFAMEISPGSARTITI
ncbi:MAG: histidine phosphatase family protein [Nanobdellota archaeon]